MATTIITSSTFLISNDGTLKYITREGLQPVSILPSADYGPKLFENNIKMETSLSKALGILFHFFHWGGK